MALPADFNKIFGSTATGGLTPIGDVNYAKGWEFVGSNPPTKNDFSYLQNLSDLKSKWLYSNKLQRTDPFGDIKSDGTVTAALANLGLGEAAKRNVGTGANQIPDMSSFTGDFSQAGYATFPGGLIIQWGDNAGSSQYTPLFKIPFPRRCIQIVASVDGGKNGVDINSRSMVEVGDITRTGFSATVFNAAGGSQQLSNRAIHWIALGV